MRYYFDPKKSFEFEDKFEDPYMKRGGILVEAAACLLVCIVTVIGAIRRLWLR
jgi:hypothetical protein